jgi:hypothetical protein
MKTLTHDEDCSKSRIKILVLASFPAIGQFAPVFTPYWMQKKSTKMYISLAASGTVFKITGGS